MNFNRGWDGMSDNERLMLALFALFVMAVVLQISNMILLVLPFVLWWLWRDGDDGEADDTDADSMRFAGGRNLESVQPHALAAVREAGMDPEHLLVLPVDIGLIAFYDDDEPALHHTRPIPDDSDYIQPFVQLRVPQAAVGSIRFEIHDHYRQQVFVHEDVYRLERGRNLVTPSAKVPLHDEQNNDGVWEMRVYADKRLLARHVFGWEHAQAPDFERKVGEDGEINSELRAILAQSRLENLSVDELLAYQDEDDGRDDAARSARR
ncbi:MAG: hypothetical protein EA396_12755 [Anaerolineaceae bacterium]|nr:MAG: hypothetical protein EA396_12755 [Anaerolineaceae bacterium]